MESELLDMWFRFPWDYSWNEWMNAASKRDYVFHFLRFFPWLMMLFLSANWIKKCSCIRKEPAERGNRYQQHLPSLPMGFQLGVVVADSSHTLIPVFFSHSFSDVIGQLSAVRHLMCHLLLEHALWAKLCNGVSWLKQEAEVCVLWGASPNNVLCKSP